MQQIIQESNPKDFFKRFVITSVDLSLLTTLSHFGNLEMSIQENQKQNYSRIAEENIKMEESFGPAHISKNMKSVEGLKEQNGQAQSIDQLLDTKSGIPLQNINLSNFLRRPLIQIAIILFFIGLIVGVAVGLTQSTYLFLT